ncbi:MAG: hypothetical protein ACI957_005685, partial [Verrucomicrobiales bacterium]
MAIYEIRNGCSSSLVCISRCFVAVLYCRASLFVIWEELEVEAHQAGKFRFERTGQIIKAVVDCIAECF